MPCGCAQFSGHNKNENNNNECLFTQDKNFSNDTIVVITVCRVKKGVNFFYNLNFLEMKTQL